MTGFISMNAPQSSTLACLLFGVLLCGCSLEDNEPMTNVERQEIYRDLDRYQQNNPSMKLTPAQNAEVAAEIEENAKK